MIGGVTEVVSEHGSIMFIWDLNFQMIYRVNVSQRAIRESWIVPFVVCFFFS